MVCCSQCFIRILCVIKHNTLTFLLVAYYYCHCSCYCLIPGCCLFVVIDIACALMRYAHLKNAEKQIEYQKIYIMDPRWWICLGFYLIGLLFSFVSLYLIRMMVVVTLTSVGVWIGLQYTTWYSGNRMKHRDYTSYAVIVAGNLLLLLVGLKANTRESAKSLSEVFDLTLNFSNNPKIMIAYLMTIIAPIGLVVIHQFEYFKRLFVPAAFTCLYVPFYVGVIHSFA